MDRIHLFAGAISEIVAIAGTRALAMLGVALVIAGAVISSADRQHPRKPFAGGGRSVITLGVTTLLAVASPFAAAVVTVVSVIITVVGAAFGAAVATVWLLRTDPARSPRAKV